MYLEMHSGGSLCRRPFTRDRGDATGFCLPYGFHHRQVGSLPEVTVVTADGDKKTHAPALADRRHGFVSAGFS
jgi:hypothetical protein